MRLESGPAATDRNYWLLFTLLCVGAAGWFFYDHKIRYPQDNRDAARDYFQQRVSGALDLGERPVKEDFDALRRDLALKSMTPDELHKNPLFAQPTYSGPDAKSGEPVEQFSGLYGVIIVRPKNGRIDAQGVEWHNWKHTREEIAGQFYWALVPVLFGVYAGYRAYRALTLRAAIDEQGMTYGGRRIPFDNMVSLRDYSPKGWVDLYYKEGEGGREEKLRIDNQKIAKFDEIVETICQAKGFENPVKAAQAEDEDEEADDGREPPA